MKPVKPIRFSWDSVEKQIEKNKADFNRKVDPEPSRPLTFKQLQIIALIKKNPGIRHCMILRVLGGSHTNIVTLLNAGYLRKEGNINYMKYYINKK